MAPMSFGSISAAGVGVASGMVSIGFSKPYRCNWNFSALAYAIERNPVVWRGGVGKQVHLAVFT